MYQSDLELALEAAKAVDSVIKQGFEKVLTISVKEGKGVVTEIDQKSEEIIVDILQDKSNYPILGEEGGLRGEKGDIYWVIDPLDGTTNFTRKIPLCAVSIALIKNNQVEVGVIYNPLLNELYSAQKGSGSYFNDRLIKVSNTSSLKESVIFINNGYPEDDKKRSAEATNRLGLNVTVRKFGTSALELGYVAKGSMEAFLCSGDELWDYAAGILIVEEAGGKITDWKGSLWDNSNSFICASNNLIHDQIIKEIQNLQI